MDFRSVTGVTIPAGNVNKISIGGVVYWKKSNNKYKIMKNGVQLAEVSMPELVRQVNSGYAQENYGIGAQIIVPYCYNLKYNYTSDLPFNFGTFTAYGEGKLGLQAHQAVPESSTITCGTYTQNNYYCSWPDSYAYEWLNSTSAEYRNDTFTVGYTRPGFLKSLPEDFVDAMNNTTHGNIDENGDSVTVSSKVFLPGATNMFAKTGEQIYVSTTVYETAGDGESQVWEYWRDRMILEQSINDYNAQPAQVTYRKTYAVGGTSLKEGQYIFLPNKTYTTSTNPYSWVMLVFDRNGRYIQVIGNSGKYLPACVIG